MALIQCKECSMSISSKAEVCPHCGVVTKSGKKAKKKEKIKKRSNLQALGCLTIIVAVILGFTVVGTPFAIFLGIVGLVLLVLGFIPVA